MNILNLTINNPIPIDLRRPVYHRPQSNLCPYPFFIVNPAGLPYIELIRRCIRKYEFNLVEEYSILEYETLARLLYRVPLDDVLACRWFMLFRDLFNDSYNHAHIFLLDRLHFDNYPEIVNTKLAIRAHLGVKLYEVRMNNQVGLTPVNYIHAPDKENIDYEFSVLAQILEMNDILLHK